MTSLTKQRVRLNMRLLGQLGPQGSGGQIKEDKPTYREQFVPPEMSMLSYFLTKVNIYLFHYSYFDMSFFFFRHHAV